MPSPCPRARLGHNRSTFVWSPAPLRPSRASLECLLLPPRSAPPIAPARLTPDLRRGSARPPTRARLLRAIAFHFAFSLSYRQHGGARARRSSAIHFQGRSIRQVSRYTLLSGCRLPWPPSCCLYRSTPFEGVLMSVESGALAPLSVHSASPVLLTKNGPLGAFCIFAPGPMARRRRVGGFLQATRSDQIVCQFKVRE